MRKKRTACAGAWLLCGLLCWTACRGDGARPDACHRDRSCGDGADCSGPDADALEEDASNASTPWTFVSFPDFLNFDIPYPNPKWDDALSWYLDQLVAEDPSFALVAGDLVNAHWWNGPRQIEHLGNAYYGGWVRRMRDHGLTPVYAAVGDHELGDDPWGEKKIGLVPHFREAFTAHMQHPTDGPPDFEERAYSIRHGELLVITVETFELHDGAIVPTVSGPQLEWVERTLVDHQDAKFKIVQGHVPVLPGVRSRSSSGLMLDEGHRSGLWNVMAERDVDLYLSGEHHAITCRRHRGVWQVVHGASWGRVPTVNYLLGTVRRDQLDIELKRIPLTLSGDHVWNFRKSEGPREHVRIAAADRDRGFETVGTLTIDKSDGGETHRNRTGLFTETFEPLEP